MNPFDRRERTELTLPKPREWATRLIAAWYFPFLTTSSCTAPCPFRNFLPDGVMVAQATLTRLVMVRIHVGQPFDALRLLMA